MSKTSFSGAAINSGPALPNVADTPNGSLFFKTGASPGLYFFGFNPDANLALFGEQGVEAWNLVVDTSGVSPYVLKTGDTMTGILNGTAFRAGQGVPNTGDSSTNGFGFGADGDTGLFSVGSGALGTSVSLFLNGVERLQITSSAVTIGGATIWTSANDGAGSGLDADLLDSHDSTFYTNLANSTGILPTNRGGTGQTAVLTQGGVIYGSTPTAMASSVAGTAGFLLQSNSTSAPSWVDPGTLSVASAVTANTANSATTAATATLATKASTLAQGGGSGAAMTFSYSGQSGQPTWLWGTNDGVSMAVWNPSNFSVASATTAGSATSASTVPWSGVTGTPTTLAGYGITDSLTLSAANAAYLSKTVGTNIQDSGGGSRFFFTSGGSTQITAGGGTAVLDTSGNLTASGNVTAFSDIRLKRNLVQITGAVGMVGRLNGVNFERIIDGSLGTGLIAQEVQEVLPQAVVSDVDGILSVAYGNLAGLFVEAIKELKAEIESLKVQLAAK